MLEPLTMIEWIALCLMISGSWMIGLLGLAMGTNRLRVGAWIAKATGINGLACLMLPLGLPATANSVPLAFAMVFGLMLIATAAFGVWQVRQLEPEGF